MPQRWPPSPSRSVRAASVGQAARLTLLNGSLSALFIAAHSGPVRHVVARVDLAAAVAATKPTGRLRWSMVDGRLLGELLYAVTRVNDQVIPPV